MTRRIERAAPALAAMLWVVWSPSPAAAVQQEPPCDAERRSAMAFLVGSWTVEATEPGEDGTRGGWSTVSAVAGGCAVQEHLRLEGRYEEVRLVAFDPGGERWQLTVVDSDHGNILLLDGHRTGSGLEFISTHQRTTTLLVDRISVTDTEAGWTYRIQAASEYGQAWRPLLELRYTPRYPQAGGAAEGSGPAARAHHQLVHHAGEGRTYLIGGSTREGEGYRYFADVWTWEGDGWARRADLPFPRSSHRAVYHSGRGSLVLFGGGFGSAVGAEGVLWEGDGVEWRALDGQAEAGRDEPGVCYDEARDTVVLFGGWGPDGEMRSDTWIWAAGELTVADTVGPSPRAGHVLLFDPLERRCLLYGGRGDDDRYLDDTWTWDGARWTQEEGPGPGPRWFTGAAHDGENDRIVLFGGRGPDGDLADTWTRTGRGWERLELRGATPEPRSMARLAFTEDGVILFGGRTITSDGFRDHGDTWVLGGDGWREVDPGGS